MRSCHGASNVLAARLAIAISLGSAALALSGHARAEEQGSPLGGELRLQLGIGGEKVAEVQYSDGSNSSLRLGTYAYFGLGGIVSPWMAYPHAFEVELLAGFGAWSTGPENTEDRLSLLRFPVDLLAFYRYQLSRDNGSQMFLRVGAGGTWHFVKGISGSGSLEGLDVDLENAPGFLFEGAFVYTIIATGVRYTRIDYEVALSGEKLDASSVGFFFSLMLEPGL